MRLENKVALITGAGRGIGAGIARRFAQEGACVVICDLKEDNVKAITEEIVNQGGRAIGVVTDVRNRQQAQEAVEKACTTFGTVDILVNNAGVNRDAFIDKMTESQWDLVMDVNLKGSYNFIQAVLDIMNQKQYGKIVNISSAGRFGNIAQANYCASKAGVVGLTRCVAKEAGPKGININAIAPGPINTEMTEILPEKLKDTVKEYVALKRWGTIEEVTDLCLFLASDEASFITGQTIECDGGLFMP